MQIDYIFLMSEVYLIFEPRALITREECIFYHRRNKERGPPIRSKMGLIRSKIEWKRTKMGPFWGAVFHENTSSKSMIRSKGAEMLFHLNFIAQLRPLG